VSYWKQVRPVFQANCQGCHQPAKDKGGYVMTEFARLLGSGDSGEKAVVPRRPEKSHLLAQITPNADGEAEMPPNKPALPAHEVDLIRRWIAEGAKDDTPANAVQRVDAKHPPVYQRPPVVTSLDFSPDGSLLAVAGFHEVLLHKADGSGIVARLVGLSERVEKVAFSPDGKLLAVAGGLPARMGEIQIWDVEQRRLTLSAPVGYDTVYGVSWSPDGTRVAFGCADNTVRAIEVSTGKQVLQQGSHNDWVLDTVFNTNGTHVVSVGRDMSTKLTEVETQRFIDNITSITPGALRGGLHAVARRPGHDEVLIGGADGVPQLYRVFRKAARRIGDNANLLRKFPPMTGRIFAVDYSDDGKLIAAGASLDGRGEVALYTGEFTSDIPADLIKTYESKVASTYTEEEKAAIEKFTTDGVKRLASLKLDSAVYAVAFSPDGTTLAAAGEDGRVRLIQTSDGSVRREFVPVPIDGRLASKVPRKVASSSTR
jgi:WD40 repeat protein